MPTIDVDDEVFSQLQAAAEPLVDTPNMVLRRLMGLGTASEGPSGASGSSVLPTPPSSAVPTKEADGTRRRGRKRVARGLLLPESEYELPILEALVESGGSARTRDVLGAVERKLKDRLTSLDYEMLRSGSVRWENRAQWARNTLVKRGWLDPAAPWGIWSITPAGRHEVTRRAGR